MTNKKVEELFREEKCLRAQDKIEVTFVESMHYTEMYNVVVFTQQGSNSFERAFSVVVATKNNEEQIMSIILVKDGTNKVEEK